MKFDSRANAADIGHAWSMLRELSNADDEPQLLGRGRFGAMYLWQTPRDMEEAVAELAGLFPAVEYACPDMLGTLAQTTPNDPAFTSQWWAWNTGQVVNGVTGTVGADVCLPDAWTARADASSVTVAVFDTGVNYLKADLAPNMWQNAVEAAGALEIDDDSNGITDDIFGAAFVSNNPHDPDCDPWGCHNHCKCHGATCGQPRCDYKPGDPFDIESGRFNGEALKLCPAQSATYPGGHGTACAELIGSVGDNTLAMAGCAWQVKIMPIRFYGTCTPAHTTSNAVNGFAYALDNGATILSCSWGIEHSPALEQAVKDLGQADVLPVVAAGNNHSGGLDLDTTNIGQYPARYPYDHIAAVAATTNTDALASFSHFGANTVDVAAPGDAVPYFPNNSHAYGDGLLLGTSFSTPIVAGIAALYRAENPSLSAAQVVEDLVATSRPVAALSGKCRANGVVSAAALLGQSCSH